MGVTGRPCMSVDSEGLGADADSWTRKKFLCDPCGLIPWPVFREWERAGISNSNVAESIASTLDQVPEPGNSEP